VDRVVQVYRRIAVRNDELETIAELHFPLRLREIETAMLVSAP
jgi:hypothetical protein